MKYWISASLLLVLVTGVRVGAAEAEDPYTAIRQAWAASEGYNPMFGTSDGRQEIIALFNEKKYPAFLAESEKYVEKTPIDIVMYALRARACAALDNMQGYFLNQAVAWGLAGSIASSGDGKTKDL